MILDLRGDFLASCVRVEGEVFVDFGPTEVEGERKEEKYVVVLGSAGLQSTCMVLMGFGEVTTSEEN